MTLKQYSYIIINDFNENDLENLSLEKFEYVTKSLVFFLLHENSHIKFPNIKDEIEIDNIAISDYLKQYSKIDKSFNKRAENLSNYINKKEVNDFFKDIL